MNLFLPSFHPRTPSKQCQFDFPAPNFFHFQSFSWTLFTFCLQFCPLLPHLNYREGCLCEEDKSSKECGNAPSLNEASYVLEEVACNPQWTLRVVWVIQGRAKLMELSLVTHVPSRPIGCAWAGHFAWQKWGGNFKQGGKFFAPRCSYTFVNSKQCQSFSEALHHGQWPLPDYSQVKPTIQLGDTQSIFFMGPHGSFDIMPVRTQRQTDILTLTKILKLSPVGCPT